MFIKTDDAETANLLREGLFTELSKEGSFFVFLNDSKLAFSDGIKDKIIYTDKLCI